MTANLVSFTTRVDKTVDIRKGASFSVPTRYLRLPGSFFARCKCTALELQLASVCGVFGQMLSGSGSLWDTFVICYIGT